MIEEIQYKIKRKGLDKSKLVVKLLKDWNENERFLKYKPQLTAYQLT